MVEPLIQMCTMSASKLNTIEMAVYMVNCLYQLQSTLSLFEYTDEHLELIQAQVQIWNSISESFSVFDERLFHIYRLMLISTPWLVRMHPLYWLG